MELDDQHRWTVRESRTFLSLDDIWASSQVLSATQPRFGLLPSCPFVFPSGVHSSEETRKGDEKVSLTVSWLTLFFRRGEKIKQKEEGRSFSSNWWNEASNSLSSSCCAGKPKHICENQVDVFMSVWQTCSLQASHTHTHSHTLFLLFHLPVPSDGFLLLLNHFCRRWP